MRYRLRSMSNCVTLSESNCSHCDIQLHRVSRKLPCPKTHIAMMLLSPRDIPRLLPTISTCRLHMRLVKVLLLRRRRRDWKHAADAEAEKRHRFSKSKEGGREGVKNFFRLERLLTASLHDAGYSSGAIEPIRGRRYGNATGERNPLLRPPLDRPFL